MAVDQQIQVAGQSAAPLSYTVPNAIEAALLCVNANIDGSGASGSFLGTVEIVSDGGLIVARCPCFTTIAAGGSAEISWFRLRQTTSVTAPTTTYENLILTTPGLVLYWKLDETSGVVVTDSLDSHDGVYVGAPTLGVPPLADVKAITLDGTVPQTAELNVWPATIMGIQANGQMTIESWIKTTAVAGGYVAVSDTQDAGGRFFQFGVDGLGRPRFSIFGTDASGHTVTGVTSLVDGANHHFVGTFDGTALSVWVDGVLDATVNPAMGGFPLAALNHGFWVGARWTQGLGYDNPYTGTVDEIALYDTALDATTIAQHNAAGHI